MPRVELNNKTPDFSLNDVEGNTVKLSDFNNISNVLVVFNRGFT